MSRDMRFEPIEIKQALEDGIRGPRGGSGFPNAIYWQAMEDAQDRMARWLERNAQLRAPPVKASSPDPETKGWR